MLPAQSMSVTLGLPSVSVPVLSRTTTVARTAPSSASADFTKMPFEAPRPVPTIIAVGVARPSAQGQEMTKTETACDRATAKSPGATKPNHATNVTSAIPMTTGTKTPAMLSARRSIGALELVASSTKRMMPASVVSSPTAVARILNQPPVDTVAPVTESPTVLLTGTGSPVIADSSTDPSPSMTWPSTGIDCPALTTSISPTTTVSAGTSCSTPSLTRIAVFGARFISALIAPVV